MENSEHLSGTGGADCCATLWVKGWVTENVTMTWLGMGNALAADAQCGHQAAVL